MQGRQALEPHSDPVKPLSYCEGVMRMAGLQLQHGRGHAGDRMQGQRPQWKTVTVKGTGA